MKKTTKKSKRKSTRATRAVTAQEASIDEASKESFPTSDPPAWTLGTTVEIQDAKKHGKQGIKDILAAEHQQIRLVLNELNELIKALEDGKIVDVQLLRNISSYLHHFVDECHHPKEELLFPKLTSGEQHPSDYVMKDLKHEHEAGKKLHLGLEKIAKRYTEAKWNESQNLIHLLKELKMLHLNHLAKEEEYIWPSIERVLTEAEKKAILESFIKIEKEIGPNSHQHFIQLVSQITHR